ncbi:MAG: hypothetical protein KGN38_12580 [Actinomycetales bacterium]|nr:hypothetical protein [Actinomycetales bacterium]
MNLSDSANPRYGTPNWDLLQRWFALPAAEDGEFWAVNLMRYRPFADYADGRESTLTGVEADDVYSPIAILEDLGAIPAFGVQVARQLAGEPEWHRVAIVRYPSRAAFFDMQRRPDFQEAHVHKDAGMEFTIVMSCDPRELPAEQPAVGHGSLVMSVRRFAEGTASTVEAEGVAPIAHFDVEGPMVGDERRWHEVRFDRIPDAALAAHMAADSVEEQIVLVLDEEQVIDIGVLVDSIATRS